MISVIYYWSKYVFLRLKSFVLDRHQFITSSIFFYRQKNKILTFYQIVQSYSHVH